ncbi:MAG: hypothetical protein MOB07_02675, partial [Acidobacteria bacterium]|nr:hypothetical protein [Acidobacteriota bacterium]
MLEISQRNRMPVERINRHASEHGVAMTRLGLDRPVDHTRLFTCPSLAPLTHTPVFTMLTPAQQRRYNQLVGLAQNELICFFGMFHRTQKVDNSSSSPQRRRERRGYAEKKREF